MTGLFPSQTFWIFECFFLYFLSLKFDTAGLKQRRFVESWHLTNTRGRKRVPESEMEFYVSSFSQSIYSSNFMTSLYQQANFTGNTLRPLCANAVRAKSREVDDWAAVFTFLLNRKKGSKVEDLKTGSVKCWQLSKACTLFRAVLGFFTIQSCEFFFHSIESQQFFCTKALQRHTTELLVW